MYVDDLKLAGKKQNLDPMWKLLNKEVDLDQHLSWIMFSCAALKTMTNKQRYCGQLQNHV